MKVKVASMAVAVFFVAGASAFAADVVGYNVVTVPASSDVLVSVPFSQDVELSAVVDSVTANGVTVTDALVEGAYASNYYVRFIDGNGEGLWSTITENGEGGFTLENADVLSYVVAGDNFRVYAHHTIDSIFPEGMKDIAFEIGTQVQVYDALGDGTYKSPISSAAYTALPAFLGGGYAWSGSADGDTVIEPQAMILVRNTSTTDALEIPFFGDVPDHKTAVLVDAGARDVVVGSGFPVATAIGDMGVEAEGRQVQVYDNSVSGQYKSPEASSTYAALPAFLGGGYAWSGSADGDTEVAGSAAFVLRLPASEAGGKITFNKPY